MSARSDGLGLELRTGSLAVGSAHSQQKSSAGTVGQFVSLLYRRAATVVFVVVRNAEDAPSGQ